MPYASDPEVKTLNALDLDLDPEVKVGTDVVHALNNGDGQPGEEELNPNGIRTNCEINCAGVADIDAPFLELSAVNINVDEQSDAEVPFTSQMSAVCHMSETMVPV